MHTEKLTTPQISHIPTKQIAGGLNIIDNRPLSRSQSALLNIMQRHPDESNPKPDFKEDTKIVYGNPALTPEICLQILAQIEKKEPINHPALFSNKSSYNFESPEMAISHEWGVLQITDSNQSVLVIGNQNFIEKSITEPYGILIAHSHPYFTDTRTIEETPAPFTKAINNDVISWQELTRNDNSLKIIPDQASNIFPSPQDVISTIKDGLTTHKVFTPYAVNGSDISNITISNPSPDNLRLPRLNFSIANARFENSKYKCDLVAFAENNQFWTGKVKVQTFGILYLLWDE